MDFSLSILIPVYNVEIEKLVQKLHLEASECHFLFEILVFDDCSALEFQQKNKAVRALKHVVYRQVPVNLGRSKLRNLLAKNAQYEYVLFLDCDVMPVADTFCSTIQNYPIASYDAVIGGTDYESDEPADAQTKLHWWVGKNREQKDATRRNLNPYGSFTLNNMLLKKSLFLDILLNEKISQYGHEDSLFGQELRKRGVKLVHVDNPVYHLGLNDSASFLYKTKQAVENLASLAVSGQLSAEIRLYAAYLRLEKFGLLAVFRYSYLLFSKLILKNLQSKRPLLVFFDCYKLNELETCMRKYQE